MIFSCEQSDLSQAVNTVSKAVSAKTTIEIMKGILIVCDKSGKVRLSAADKDIRIDDSFDADVEETGSVVVLSRLFSEIIRKLPEGQILIRVNDNNTMTVKTSSSDFTIVCLEADEFPKAPELSVNADSVEMDKLTLSDMFSKTSFAASIDDARGVMTGVFIKLSGNSLTMAALDGFRMAVLKRAVESSGNAEFIINAKVINNVSRIMADSDEEINTVNISNDGKHAVFSIGRTTVSARLMEGSFIDYESIIPSSSKTRIFADRRLFTDSIERAALLAKEGKHNLVRLSISDNIIAINSRSEEGIVNEEIIVEKEGEDLNIGFNSKYILDVLKVIDDDNIAVEFNTRVSPAVIKPVTGDIYIYIVLPVRIQF